MATRLVRRRILRAFRFHRLVARAASGQIASRAVDLTTPPSSHRHRDRGPHQVRFPRSHATPAARSRVRRRPGGAPITQAGSSRNAAWATVSGRATWRPPPICWSWCPARIIADGDPSVAPRAGDSARGGTSGTRNPQPPGLGSDCAVLSRVKSTMSSAGGQEGMPVRRQGMLARVAAVALSAQLGACGDDSSESDAGGGEPSSPCEHVLCSGRRTCQERDGEAVCACEPPHVVEGLHCLEDDPGCTSSGTRRRSTARPTTLTTTWNRPPLAADWPACRRSNS